MKKIFGYNQKHYLLLLAIISSLILGIIHLSLRAYAFDDAYIHFRIAAHLADFGEPYFNQGDAVMASSSSGWTIILASVMGGFKLIGFTASLPVLASVINAIACACGAYIYTLLLDQLVHKPPSTLFRILFFLTYLGLILSISTGLMETPTVMLLAGLGLLFMLKQSRWGLVILGALPFFRPELVMVSVLAGIFILITKRFSIKETVLFFILGAVPFILYDLYFFRTLIPNTIAAKSLVYSLTYIATFRYFLSKIYDGLALLGMWLNISLLQKLYYVGYVLWVTISISVIYTYKIGREFFIRKRLDEKDLLGLLFLALSGLVVGAYLYRRVLIFSWYDPLYTIPLLIIIAKTIVDIQPKRLATVLGIMLLPVLLVQLSSLVQVGMAAFIDPLYAPEFLSSARVRNYIQIGTQLYKQYPKATLMTSEIGGLGYGFQGYIYDGVGLVSPEALKYQPLKNAMAIGGIPAGFVQEVKPDLIVSYDVYMQDLLHNDVLRDYVQYKYPLLIEDDLLRVGDEPVYNSVALNVYVRKGLTPSVEISP
jgi:hypothetical protein